MIIIRLQGGIGNQLFQYAYGISLMEKRGHRVYFDVSLLGKVSSKHTLRKFGLRKIIDPKKVIGNGEFFSPFIICTMRLFEVLNHFKIFKNRIIVYLIEKNKMYDETISNIIEDSSVCILRGFWQSPKYIENSLEMLGRQFAAAFSKNRNLDNYLSLIESRNVTSIHIRRGDYLSNTNASHLYFHLDFSYYSSAINRILLMGSCNTFMIFSDDPVYCHKFIESLATNNEYIIVSNNKMIDDMDELMLMSACNNNIIANSTFSYWGAMLNSHQDKITIAPKKWYRDSNDFIDLYPNDWIKM